MHNTNLEELKDKLQTGLPVFADYELDLLSRIPNIALRVKDGFAYYFDTNFKYTRTALSKLTTTYPDKTHFGYYQTNLFCLSVNSMQDDYYLTVYSLFRGIQPEILQRTFESLQLDSSFEDLLATYKATRASVKVYTMPLHSDNLALASM